MKNSWYELDLGILRDNVRVAREALGRKSELIFVVKSNAYGHGLRPVARCAWECGVRRFAVADIDEAADLKHSLSEARVLVVGALDPSDVEVAIREDVSVVLVSEEHGAALAAAARDQGGALRCHVKIDTGMGRLGFEWGGVGASVERLTRSGGLVIEGACTHFASAGTLDSSFADEQARRFQAALADSAARGMRFPFVHVSNTAAFSRNAAWDFDGVRLGILLYGYGPKGGGARIRTRPFLQWKSRVVQVKSVPAGFPVSYDSTHVTVAPTRLATVAVGYADGYSRLLSNRGRVIVGGAVRPVVGRVTMNFISVDVGSDSGAREGDVAVLLGEDGGQAVWADALAEWCGTIPYEILTGIRSPLSPEQP